MTQPLPRVVIRMGSTTLILKGSMMVFMFIPFVRAPGLKLPAGPSCVR